MAGKPKAPRLWWDETKERWRLRFTHEGQRYEFANSAIKRTDASGASKWQSVTVADVLAGRWGRVTQGSDPNAKLSEAAAAYLADKTGGEIGDGTAETRKMHLRAHLVPAFRRLSDITAGSLESYQSRRLREVRYETIKKELSTLRQILNYALLNGWITSVPPFPKRPAKSRGTRHRHGNAGATRGVTAEMIRAMIPRLPELSRKSRVDGIRWPIRALIAVMYESGLRLGFWTRFRMGTHWRPGWRHLEITEESDKNRWQRRVPLTSRAVEILEATPVQPDGRMFADRDFRETIRKAAREVMPEEVADRFHLHDIRHVRTTELMAMTSNPIGVGYLVGHTQATTTNRYAHQHEGAALQVLSLLESSGTGPQSGDDVGAQETPEGAGECTAAPSELLLPCAKRGTRTPTGVTPPAPQGGLSESGSGISAVSETVEARQTTPEGAHSGDRPQIGDLPALIQLVLRLTLLGEPTAAENALYNRGARDAVRELAKALAPSWEEWRPLEVLIDRPQRLEIVRKGKSGKAVAS